MITIPNPEPWTVDALCSQVDTDLFYPEKGANNQQAKELCQRCPVQTQCLEAGLYETHGIWGGLTPRERREIRQQRGIVLPGGWSWNAVCGTEAGARQHYRHKETPCDACLTAARVAGRERARRRGA